MLVTLRAPRNYCKLILIFITVDCEGMVEKNKGHIVNITSIAGSFATANLTDYCASKFGAIGNGKNRH